MWHPVLQWLDTAPHKSMRTPSFWQQNQPTPKWQFREQTGQTVFRHIWTAAWPQRNKAAWILNLSASSRRRSHLTGPHWLWDTHLPAQAIIWESYSRHNSLHIYNFHFVCLLALFTYAAEWQTWSSALATARCNLKIWQLLIISYFWRFKVSWSKCHATLKDYGSIALILISSYIPGTCIVDKEMSEETNSLSFLLATVKSK